MENENQLQVVLGADYARLNITYANQNGELRDPIPYAASDADIKQWATEAVQNGDIAGFGAHPDVSFRDFVVQRFTPTEERPYNLIMLRPKTPFGVAANPSCNHPAPTGRASKRLTFKDSPESDASIEPLDLDDKNKFDTVKVFSATKAREREGLGDIITGWLQANPTMIIVDKVVSQSSDNEFHCLSITFFCRKG